MPENSGFPYPEVTSVEDILQLADVEFVRCAYLKILGREPDPIGGRHYLSLVRSGYSKLTVLGGLHASDEAKGRLSVLEGLDHWLRKHRTRTRTPFGIAVGILNQQGDDRYSRRRRAVSNFVDAQYAALDRETRAIESWGGPTSLKFSGSDDADALSAISDRIEAGFAQANSAALKDVLEDLRKRLLRIESILLRAGITQQQRKEAAPPPDRSVKKTR